jgi:murein DD-endopeptidase MepM/ murein hydrolase activator NlpD
MRRRQFLGALAVGAGLAAASPARRLTRAESSASRQLTAMEPRLRLPALARDGRPPTASASASVVQQGGALWVQAATLAAAGRAEVFARSSPLTRTDTGVEGFVGFSTGDPPGPTWIGLVLDGPTGPESLFVPVDVRETSWTVDYIYVPPPQPGDPDPLDPAEIVKEQQLLAATWAGQTGRKWRHGWQAPVEDFSGPGDITAYFGEQRSFNDGPVQGHHGGTDFGRPAGAPVLATNDGVVVVARELVVRGNMVIVDHGGGVFSGYAHLSALNVSEGEAVAQGQVVGAVGSTGLSTGPHLHWEMAVAGVLVDGLRWLDGSQGF